MDLGQIVLVLCGGAGGAILTWIGTLINNSINHNRELVRMTYQRKLMVCENTMGILGAAKDNLTSVRVYLNQDISKMDVSALQETASNMQNLINTTVIEIYKLYLYYDIEEIERKLKMQEVFPMVLNLNSEMSELNEAMAQGRSSVEEQDLRLHKSIASLDYLMTRLDSFFTEIIELMKEDVKKKL